jgi:hypothetical protein
MTDEPITREEYDKFRRAVIKKLKFLEGLISDAFQSISDLESKENELVDEAIARAARAERAVRRLKKEFDES